jgi:hypothetical protein
VGASLLAIAVPHSADVLTETPQSPAGWLPQLTELTGNKNPPNGLWGDKDALLEQMHREYPGKR